MIVDNAELKHESGGHGVAAISASAGRGTPSSARGSVVFEDAAVVVGRWLIGNPYGHGRPAAFRVEQSHSAVMLGDQRRDDGQAKSGPAGLAVA